MLRISKCLSQTNYFNLLKVPQQFKINEKTLKQNFRNLQKEHHPDKLINKITGNTPKYSSSEINKAYKCLKTPIDRGLYMIHLHNKQSLEDLQYVPYDEIDDGDAFASKSERKGKKLIVNSPEFLMEMFEFNEELDDTMTEIDIGKKDENIINKWNELAKTNNEKRVDLIEIISNNFELHEFDKAFDNLAKLKYYESIKYRMDNMTTTFESDLSKKREF